MGLPQNRHSDAAKLCHISARWADSGTTKRRGRSRTGEVTSKLSADGVLLPDGLSLIQYRLRLSTRFRARFGLRFEALTIDSNIPSSN